MEMIEVLKEVKHVSFEMYGSFFIDKQTPENFLDFIFKVHL